jgi:dipeptidyl aminopeptidase/acylaminoacyl peptidase
MGRWLSLIVLVILVCACSASPQAQAPTAAPPPPTPAPTAPPSPTAEPAPSATPRPSSTPAPSPTSPPSATPTSSLTPTADPVAGFTIPDLRSLPYGEGEISIGAVYNRGPGYTSYQISYPSADGLTLTGLLHIPDGEGPFPLIIANRGHIDPERYQPGMDSRAFSDYFAQRGYLVVAPDYRGYAGGDEGPNPFYTGYYIDILSVIPLAQRLPMARPGKVGVWGHSRGASGTVAAITVSDQIAAAVIYAPAPADLAADYERRMRQSGGNPGSDTFPFPPEANPEAYTRVSPITYFDAVQAPVMLHHGTADTTVDASASVAIADALRAAGKDVTLHLYEGGGHTLTGAQEQLYFERTLAFFEAALGGQG